MISVSNSLKADSVGPDLGSNCLQRLPQTKKVEEIKTYKYRLFNLNPIHSQ